MKSINVFWYRMKGNKKNFGDELGPYIVNKLTGCKVIYIPIADTPINIIIYYIYGVFKGVFSISILGKIFRSLFVKEIFISAGSILSKVKKKKSIVWGAGISTRDSKLVKAKYLAVRGKITNERLKELDINAPDIFGDPALLLPVLYSAKQNKKYKLGIIPHYMHYNKIKSLIKNDEILVINMYEPVEQVIEKINSCEINISSSLHGIIVSQAYNIPCLWYNLADTKLAGDNTKFLDYFSSVGIKEYDPFPFIFDNDDIYKIINNVQNNLIFANIQSSLFEIQKGLIQSFPFQLTDQIKLQINKVYNS